MRRLLTVLFALAFSGCFTFYVQPDVVHVAPGRDVPPTAAPAPPPPPPPPAPAPAPPVVQTPPTVTSPPTVQPTPAPKMAAPPAPVYPATRPAFPTALAAPATQTLIVDAPTGVTSCELQQSTDNGATFTPLTPRATPGGTPPICTFTVTPPNGRTLYRWNLLTASTWMLRMDAGIYTCVGLADCPVGGPTNVGVR